MPSSNDPRGHAKISSGKGGTDAAHQEAALVDWPPGKFRISIIPQKTMSVDSGRGYLSRNGVKVPCYICQDRPMHQKHTQCDPRHVVILYRNHGTIRCNQSITNRYETVESKSSNLYHMAFGYKTIPILRRLWVVSLPHGVIKSFRGSTSSYCNQTNQQPTSMIRKLSAGNGMQTPIQITSVTGFTSSSTHVHDTLCKLLIGW